MNNQTKKPIEPRTLPGFRDFLPEKLKSVKTVAVFIDAANILYSQQTIGWKVDYKKLIKLLQKDFIVVFAGFYYGKIDSNKGQENFFKMLADRGYTVRTKPVKYIKTPKGTILKGNLDIELAFDVLTLKEKFDTCILFSGDSDFEIILKHLRGNKIKVVVVSAKNHVSIELIRNCDKYIDLKKLEQLIRREEK